MTNHNFEKRIKDKMNGFEVEPSENLLESILEQRAIKYKGLLRLSYLKLGVAALALLIVSVAVFLNRSAEGNESLNPKDNPETAVVDNSGGTDLNKRGENSNGQSYTENEKQVKKGSVETNNISGDIQQNNKVNSLPEAQKSANGSDKIAHSNKRTKSHVSQTQFSDNADRKENSRLTRKNNGMKKGNTAGMEADYADNGQDIASRYFNIDADNRPLISAVYHKGQSHLIVYHSVSSDKLEQMDLNYLFIKPVKSLPSLNVQMDQLALLEYPSFKISTAHRKPVFIDLMVTPVYTIQRAEGKSSVSDNYNSMAKSGLNKQYNLRISYPVSERMNVFTGLGWMDLTTRYKGDFENAYAAVRYEKVTNYINDPILGTIAVSHIDTINYTRKDQLNYNLKNTCQLLNIPVGMSYNFGVKKFDFAVHGSALINVFTSAKGSNADFVSDQTSAYSSEKMHLGMGAGLSFMSAYRINNKLRLIVEPGLQYFKVNGAKTGNTVNEKILNNGLSIGLRYIIY